METFKTSDGLSLRYAVDDYTDPWRATRTLIMLHAAMGSSRRFNAWVPHLARDYRVVRLDMRGHGASDPAAEGPLEFERYGQDVVELLDHLGIEAAHFAGSSAGGIIAQSVAIRHPSRVKTLASFAAVPGMKNGKVNHGRWVSHIGQHGIAAFLRETIADRIPLDRVDPRFVDWFITESARTDVSTLARFVPMMATIDLVPQLQKIRCPVLIVVPGADPIHPVSDYHLFKQQIPDCQFVVYEGFPHNITDVVPDRCAEELKQFLSAHA